ncbi:MAG: hypothetical protein GX558_04530, partial [Clostridiales bacterium]|nr:hypothetical protein [Clostridiales bacterium]
MAKRRPYKKRPYSIRSLMHEREYGFYWYAWLWSALRPVLVFLCAAVVTVGLTASGWRYIYGHTLSPVDAADPTTVTFEIERGSSVSSIADQLVRQNLLRNKGVFKYVIMFQGLTSHIHYGSYQISPSMNVNQIIQVLTSGSASTERTITIIPGWTVPDIGAYLLRIGAIKDEQAFYDLCNDSVKFSNYYTVQQAAADNSIAGRKYVLEGYLAPNTYRVFTDASAEDILRTLMDQTDTVLNDVYNKVSQDDALSTAEPSDDDEQPFASTLTRDQTIILASMIEKE